MMRKLLLPALLVGLLGGCVTGYGYRDGYYYGQPSVEYRYHDYGYPYGYHPYGYGYYPYGERYYFNYYYSPYYGRYRHPYYPYYYYRHRKPPVTGTPGPDPRPGDTNDDDRGDRPPLWRDLNRRRVVDGTPLQQRRHAPAQPRPEARPAAPPRENRADGSPMRQVMQRAKETRRRSSGAAREP